MHQAEEMASAGTTRSGEDIEFYCPAHKKTFHTTDYLTAHRNCSNVRPVHQVVKELYDSGTVDEIQKRLEKYNSQADVLLTNRRTEMDFLLKRKRRMFEEISEFRVELCSSLTALESDVIKQISQKYKEPIEKINAKIEKCRRLTVAMKNADTYLKETDRSGSDVDYIKAVLAIQRRCLFYEDALKKEYDSLENYMFAFVPNEELKETWPTAVSLGDVEAIRGKSKLPGFYSDAREVCHGDCKIKIVSVFDTRCHTDEHKPSVTGVCYLPNGHIVFVDRGNNAVKMFNDDGLFEGNLKFKESPWDITSYDKDTFVITFPSSKIVRFIKYDPKMTIDNTKLMDFRCWGITHNNGTFAVTCDPWTISACVKFLSKEFEVISTLSLDTEGKQLFKAPLYVISRKKSLEYVFSDAGTHLVLCIGETGNVVFTYRNPELRYPVGLTTDHQSNIYVCGRSSNNIHQLTHDGKLTRILLSNKDITSPNAVSSQYHGNRMALVDSGHDSINIKVTEFV